MQQVTVTVEIKGGHAMVHLQGEIDIATAEPLKSALDTAVEHPAVHALDLDFSQVSFIDCSGLRVLVGAKLAMEGRGGALSVVNLSPAVERLLTAAGLDRHLHAAGHSGDDPAADRPTGPSASTRPSGRPAAPASRPSGCSAGPTEGMSARVSMAAG
jgi:anti-anti-sigma factor